MNGLIFEKLNNICELDCLKDDKKAREYRKTQDYNKICQIVEQYQKKYEKDIGNLVSKWNGYEILDG